MVPGLWACPLGCWQPPNPGVRCSRPASAAWAGHLLLPAFKHSLGPSFWRPFHRPGYGQAHTIRGPFAVHPQGPRAPPSLLRLQMRLGLQQLPSSGWGSQLENYRMELRSLHRSWGPPEKEPGRGRKVSRRKWGLGGASAASDDKGTSKPFGSASHPPPRPPQTHLLKALTSTASTRIRVQVTGDLEFIEKVPLLLSSGYSPKSLACREGGPFTILPGLPHPTWKTQGRKARLRSGLQSSCCPYRARVPGLGGSVCTSYPGLGEFRGCNRRVEENADTSPVFSFPQHSTARATKSLGFST